MGLNQLGVLCELCGESLPVQASWQINIDQYPENLTPTEAGSELAESRL